MPREERYVASQTVRFSRDQMDFLEKIANDLGVSTSEAVRDMVNFYRMVTSEDLKFWEVIKYAIPHVTIKRHEDVKKLLEEGKIDEAKRRTEQW